MSRPERNKDLMKTKLQGLCNNKEVQVNGETAKNGIKKTYMRLQEDRVTTKWLIRILELKEIKVGQGHQLVILFII